MNLDDQSVSRRRFLTVAAVGGLVSGTVAVGQEKKEKEKKEGDKKNDPERMMQEPHTCRGLNTCKGKGKGGGNDCAGQGKCATAEAHTCKGDNTCKGQGGCGEYAGQNACKGQGTCAVPLKDSTWKKARTNFEAVMKKAGKKVGPAPPK
jgi:hypothetical protein